ncbi:MAG: ROK family protein [Dysosmobacter sp.]
MPLSRLFRSIWMCRSCWKTTPTAPLWASGCAARAAERRSFVVTLGTGVGGGLILNGKLYSGSGMVGEVGHMVIQHGGAPCNCGRRGCWERYASATGLIRMTREAMEAHPESLLHTVAASGGVEGRTAFDAAEQGDETALEVCRAYVEYLAAGVTNLVNILQPEAVAIGGGVAAAPEHCC